jgi:RNA ligase (TIGR02306 family)
MDKKSTHKVEVVPVILEKHPNADSLSIVKVFDYHVCVRTQDWVGVDKGAYVVPDSLVPNKGPFKFLFKPEDNEDKKYRVTVKKLRGVLSMGFLVPAPVNSKIGDDISDILGVTRYEPPEPMLIGGESVKPPELFAPIYDVDTMYRYAHCFVPNEQVIVTEKIHGTSARYTYHNGQIYCGSRTEWKKDSESNVWWKALRKHPELEEFLKLNPDIVVYGEVYGAVQNLKYGHQSGHVSFAVFDILKGSQWLNFSEAKQLGKNLPWVPCIGITNFDLKLLKSMAEGCSLIPGVNHIREGVVVKPIHERTHPEIGRVQLKIVSNAYLETIK